MTHRPLSTSKLHLTLMLALTFSTGVCDAVGYVGLNHVFTGNMTGNIVLIGISIGEGELPVLRPALALAAFLLGAACTGVLLRSTASGWTTRITVAFGFAAAVLAGLAALLAFTAGTFGLIGDAATFILAFVMGLQAAAARKLKVAEVSTVVVTSTLTALASDLGFKSESGSLWIRRTLAVGLILLGALIGGALLVLHVWLGVALSAVITGAVALCGHLRAEADTASRLRPETPVKV